MSNCKGLDLENYRKLISLNKKFEVQVPSFKKKKEKEDIVDKLLDFLQSELLETPNNPYLKSTPSSYTKKRELLYTLLTIRKAKPFPSWFYDNIDQLLLTENEVRSLIPVSKLPRIADTFPNTKFQFSDICSLWQGDITTLKIDSIVNAANVRLLGCFKPHHKCIDNIIHSFAGPRVREDCNTIIQQQGCVEEIGWAKITRAYNLPSKFILHTVGPIYGNIGNEEQSRQLSSCYNSCLDLASRIPAILSIAFCSISTGVFGYPFEKAAKVALNTVERWLRKHPKRFELIVFDVYEPRDYNAYQNLLKGE